MKKKLDFIIVGTQKGGTTALDVYLRKHPQVVMPTVKEIHYFDNENYFKTSKPDYRQLESFFESELNYKVKGECTPIYMYFQHCISRIHEYNSNIKLIVILRNPIERAFSQWNMEVNRNVEHHNFDYAIKNENERIKHLYSEDHRNFSYVNRGLYASQIDNIFKYFHKDQVLFIKYETFKNNQLTTLNTIFTFLDIDCSLYKFENQSIHETKYNCEMTSDQKSFLLNIFETDIKNVEKLLNWSCEDWLNIL